MSNNWFVTRAACPVCGQGGAGVVHASQYDSGPVRDYLVDYYSERVLEEMIYLRGAGYVLLECASCGLIYQRDVPGDDLMKRLYDRWIGFQQEARLRPSPNRMEYYTKNAAEVMQIIAFVGKPPAEQRIFDFGMGWSHWAMMVKAFGCQASGTELSPLRIEHARANGIEVLSWDEIPLRRFDMINTEQVFEHIPQPLATLRHLRQALAPGGILKISVPEGRGMKSRLLSADWSKTRLAEPVFNAVAPLEHINCFSRRSIITMAEKAGMEEVFIPMRIQYRYSSDWSSVKQIARNLAMPVLRNLVRNRNYVFVRNRLETPGRPAQA